MTTPPVPTADVKAFTPIIVWVPVGTYADVRQGKDHHGPVYSPLLCNTAEEFLSAIFGGGYDNFLSLRITSPHLGVNLEVPEWKK